MSGPIRVCGEQAKRRGVIEKGQVIPGHAHNFLHTTYVLKGAIRVWQMRVVGNDENGNAKLERVRSVDVSIEMEDNWVDIHAGVYHELEGLADRSVYDCVYVHRKEDGERVDHYTAWEPAYT